MLTGSTITVSKGPDVSEEKIKLRIDDGTMMTSCKQGTQSLSHVNYVAPLAYADADIHHMHYQVIVHGCNLET